MIKQLQIPQLVEENGSSKKYHRSETTSNYLGVITIDSLAIQNAKALDFKAVLIKNVYLTIILNPEN